MTTLTGGAQPLKSFIENYEKEMKKFKAASVSQPVIAVVDNDAANNGLWKMLEEKFNYEGADGTREFYYVVKDLYIVPIPKIDGNDTFIEHLFDQETRDTPLGGKTFDLYQKKTKKMDADKYGKMAFATKVIQKNTKALILIISCRC